MRKCTIHVVSRWHVRVTHSTGARNQNHLETRNPASAPNSQNDLSACTYTRPTDRQCLILLRYDTLTKTSSPLCPADRDYIGVELVQGLVDIVFPSKVENPTGPGDPIKDYKGHPVLAPEIKFAALDVLVESLRRQVATASALRKLLTLSVSAFLSSLSLSLLLTDHLGRKKCAQNSETMGTVLRSGYDVHLSALMIDIAYRLLPGRRKSSTTQAMSKRFMAMEALFPEEVYGRNEADDLRKLFDALDKGDWREQSTEILHRISDQNIKRSVRNISSPYSPCTPDHFLSDPRPLARFTALKLSPFTTSAPTAPISSPLHGAGKATTTNP